MARKRSARAAAVVPSSELGNGDYATNYTSAGRAIRKCRSLQAQDSAQDWEDSAEDDDYDDMSDEIAVSSSRKRRKRAQSASPTRELPSDDDLEDAGMISDNYSEPHDRSSTQHQQVLAGHFTVNLTVNIPLNHQGLISLCLDPKNLTAGPNKLTDTTPVRFNARSKNKHNSAGFLDLPAELKNIIYREVLVVNTPLSFRSPGRSFSRTAALLRACKQVYVCVMSSRHQLQISLDITYMTQEEGRSVLYSENTFVFERRSDKYGSLWSSHWRELGYLSIRKFLKSIGPSNTALIRHLTLALDDAVPYLNPNTTLEERRFVHDDELMSVLRHLAQHSQLQSLKLHFSGRRRVDRGDDRFLDNMRRVRADSVEFITYREHEYGRESKQEDCVKKSLLTACTRKHKKFDV